MIVVKTWIYGLLAFAVILVLLWTFDPLSSPIPWILVWVGSSLWVYFDARRIMGDQNGRAELRSAELWTALVFVAWGIFFFYYLIDRSSIKRRVAEYNEIPAEYRFPIVKSPGMETIGIGMLMVIGVMLAIPAFSWLSSDSGLATDHTGVPFIDEHWLSSPGNYDVSGDERLIVFTSKNKERDLYLLDRHTRKMIQLTRGPESDVRPRFSPDGNNICYSSISQETGQAHIWIMNLRDHTKHQVTWGDLFDYEPSFDATGNHLVFTRADEKRVIPDSGEETGRLFWVDRYICIESVDGDNLQTIKLPEWTLNITNPVFTSQGDAILYSATIFEMPGAPASSDFDKLLFKKLLHARQEPHVVTRPDKKNKDKDTDYAINAEVARDGKIIAFVSNKRVASADSYDLAIMKSDGSNARLLRRSAPGNVSYESPRFNKKGDSLYFIKVARVNSLWKLHLPTNREEKVLDEAVFKDPAKWQLKATTKSQKAAAARPR